MRFYKMTNGSWETDRIRAGKHAVLEEIPTTSKPALLVWLNKNTGGQWSGARAAGSIPAPSTTTTPKQTGAVAELARMDEPRVDEICEVIGSSSGYPLVRFAGAVAVAFTRLTKSRG